MLESIAGYLDVSSNSALISLEMPALRSVNERAALAASDVVIRNIALPTCHVEALRRQLIAAGFQGTIA